MTRNTPDKLLNKIRVLECDFNYYQKKLGELSFEDRAIIYKVGAVANYMSAKASDVFNSFITTRQN